MNIIFTYSSGRCGTGYLSYIFGESNYSKEYIHINNDSIISHEPWQDIPVGEIKKLKNNSNEYFSLCDKYLKEKFYYFNKKNIFITDHKLGRYFLPFLINSNYNFKIIKINRNSNDIANSFDLRLKKRSLEYNDVKYKKYYNELWKNSLFEPNDIFIENKNLINLNWNEISDFNKFYWYANEVSNQWYLNKIYLNKNKYLEINFLDFISNEIGLDKISNFINIKYNKNIIINNKINK